MRAYSLSVSYDLCNRHMKIYLLGKIENSSKPRHIWLNIEIISKLLKWAARLI